DAFEGSADDLPGRSGDDEERERASFHLRGEQVHEVPDITLQPDAPAGLDEVLAPDTPELRVVAEQVGQLAALLDEIAARETGYFGFEIGRPDDLAEDDAGVVEAQCLVEVAGDEVVLAADSHGHGIEYIHCHVTAKSILHR